MKASAVLLALCASLSLCAMEVTNPTKNSGNPREAVANSADGKTSTKWCVNIGKSAVWQMKLDAPKTFTSCKLTSANDMPDRDPKNWTVEASKDGKTWVKLADVKNNPKFAKRFETKEFKFNNKTPYTWYRIVFSATNGDGMIQLSEIAFQ